jgi:hypothetical protein
MNVARALLFLGLPLQTKYNSLAGGEGYLPDAMAAIRSFIEL